MTIARVGTVAKGTGTSTTGYTTNAIDTTGANLLVWTISSGVGDPTLSDSKGNTWVLAVTTFSTAESSIFYCAHPIVGTAHTFTEGASPGYSSGQVRAYSGLAYSPLDQTNSGQALGSTTVSTGSVTPTEDNELIVATFNNDHATAAMPTIDGGFGNVDGDIGQGAVYNGCASADLIQTTATAANPTWTNDLAQNLYATIATFKVLGPAGIGNRLTMGGSRTLLMNGGGLNLMGGANGPKPSLFVRQAVQRAAVR